MRLTINLPEIPPRTSEVFIGEGLLKRLPESLEEYLEGRRAFWIWDGKVWDEWGERLTEEGWPGRDSGYVLLFEASEANKHLQAVEELASRLVRAGADRGSALVAVGGGVTGDVVGFLASIYMRGIPHCQVPTTLLAQVDSSIGGKTGVDLPEGKNLIGSFQQPRVTWMDPLILETLSRDEFRQGMAEVIKTAMIGDEVLWKYLESHGDTIGKQEPEALLRIISACCILKARVVELDEREAGHRRVLNLGHTIGHALERVSGYQLRHGDAVAIGLVAATRLSVQLGEFPAADLTRLVRLCADWGLPVKIPRSFDPDAVMGALEADKKRIGKKLHFILPVRIGEVVDYDGLDRRDLRRILDELKSG